MNEKILQSKINKKIKNVYLSFRRCLKNKFDFKPAEILQNSHSLRRRSGGKSVIIRFNGLLPFPVPNFAGFLPVSVIFIFLVFAVEGQDNVTGRFRGDVYDKNREPIAFATVIFTNEETGISFPVQTDSQGSYSINALKSGSYTIQVKAENYLENSRKAVLRATEEIVVIPSFYLDSVVNTAIVSATGASPVPTPLPTTRSVNIGTAGKKTDGIILQARRGGSFGLERLKTVPIGGLSFVRSFDELAFLLPGVNPPPQAVGNTVGPGVGSGIGTSGQFSVNGLRSRGNNFMVDGSDNNDEDIGVRRQGFFSLIPQPADSVQEFTVITLAAPAQFGRNLGAQVNLISRSGGKNFHGTLSGFFNSDLLNARNYFDFVGEIKCNAMRVGGKCPLTGLQKNNLSVPVFKTFAGGGEEQIFIENSVGNKDSSTFFQAGATFGGTIFPEKMFFFVAGEIQKLNAVKETHFAVPTVEQGGFLGTGAEGIGFSAPTTVIGSYVLGLFPFPNDPNGLYGRNTYTRVLPANARGRVFSLKTENIFGKNRQKQILTSRYNYTDDWRDLQQVGGAVFSGIRPYTRTDNFSAFLAGQITADLSNVFRLSWGRTRLRFEENKYTESYLNPTTRLFSNSEDRRFLLNSFGLVNNTSYQAANVPPNRVRYKAETQATVENLLGPVGQVNIAGFSPVGVDVFNFPQQRVNNTFQLADSLFLSAEKHNLTFGADIRRTYLQSNLPTNSRLLITSTGGFRDPTSSVPACNAELLAVRVICLPDLISPIDLITTGTATGVFQSLMLPGADNEISLSFNQLNFFVQDDYKVKPNFSLSLGLRYEFNTVPKEADNKIEETFQTVLPAQLAGLAKFIDGRTKIYDSDANNFAPRFGFAFASAEKTVIRGGYGLYYDQILGSVVSRSRNVFPTFSTVNFGGAPNGNVYGIRTPYNLPSPFSQLIRNGTLNTLVSLETLLNYFSSNANIFPTPFGSTLPTKKLEMPLSHQYTFSFEQNFPYNLTASVGYVGTTGRNLLRFTTPNLGRNNILKISGVSLSDFQPNLTGTSNAPSVSGGNGRPEKTFGPVEQFETTGNSRYDSLQTEIRGKIFEKLDFQVSYTFAKAEDDVSDVFDLAGAYALPQNSKSFAGEYAPANFDVRHRLTYILSLNLPKIKRQNAFLRQVFGGWQFSVIGSFNTGQPFTVNTIYDVNQDGNSTDRLNNLNSIVETGNARQPLKLTSNNLLSMLAAVGQDGLVPRNSFRAGSIFKTDISFNKNFPVFKGQNLFFKLDVFNVTNKRNFGVPVRILESPGFGQTVETVTPSRSLHIGLKYVF